MSETIKILTYNIHRGLSFIRKKNIHSKIEAFLQHAQADLICLQEVWGEFEQEPSIVRNLSRTIWQKKVYGKNAIFPQGHQGNAVLCRFEILEWRNIDISLPMKEARGFLMVKAETEQQKTPFWLICLHFGLHPKERDFQFKLLSQYIKKLIPPQAPLLIAGDFNDWRGYAIKKFISENQLWDCVDFLQKNRKNTFPAYLPMVAIDRILFRNCRCLHTQVYRFEYRKMLSDHLPVEAEFVIE